MSDSIPAELRTYRELSKQFVARLIRHAGQTGAKVAIEDLRSMFRANNAAFSMTISAAITNMLPRGVRSNIQSTDLVELESFIEWTCFGQQSFVLSTGLCAGLRLTDPSGCDPAHPLPFPAFVVAIPRGLRPQFESSTGSGPVDVELLLIRDMYVGAAKNGDTKMLVLTPDEYIKKVIDVSKQEQRRKMVVVARSASGNESFTFHYPVVADVPWFMDLASDAEVSSIDRDCGRVCGRIVANLLCYLDQCRTASDRPGVLAEAIRKTEAGAHHTYHVGSEIHLHPQAEAALQRGGVSGWKLMSRFMVRGHWRNQPHGHGRLERRRKWIQPYWKGPTTAQESLDRSYRVEQAGPLQ